MRLMRNLPFVAALALTAACSGGTSTTDESTAAASQALDPASNASDAVATSGLMRGPEGFRPDAIEGFRCDPNPVITTVAVCGKELPATVHLEWTDCAAPQGPEGMGPPPPPMDGGPQGMGPPPPPPPPPFMDGGCPMGPPPAGAGPHGGPGMGPQGGPGGGSGMGPRGGPSSGVVDIVNTYQAPADCAGTVTAKEVVTFQIDRTLPNGDLETAQGTTTSTTLVTPGVGPQSKSAVIDVTRTVHDAAGTVLHSVQLSGTHQVAFSGGPPPSRTVNGTMTATFLDGTQGQVTLTDVVRPPRQVCPWPISGTLVRTAPDGTSHTLVYGPKCGDATLDGSAVQRPNHGPGPGGPGGPGDGGQPGGPRGPGGMGGPGGPGGP